MIVVVNYIELYMKIVLMPICSLIQIFIILLVLCAQTEEDRFDNSFCLRIFLKEFLSSSFFFSNYCIILLC